jgi:hypothetical protein
MKKVFKFINKSINKTRKKLSKKPVLYSIIAGAFIVLFWRGIWHTTDILETKGGILGFIFSGPVSIILSLIVLLFIGVFVSEFVGDVFLMYGFKKEKEVMSKTKDDVEVEKKNIENVEQVIDDLYEEIDQIGDKQVILEKKIEEQTELIKKMLDK